MSGQEKLVKDLNNTVVALLKVDAMAAVLEHAAKSDAASGLEDHIIQNYAATIRELLIPTWEAVQDAVRYVEVPGD